MPLRGGIGAVAYFRGRPVEYIITQFTASDAERFGVAIGDNKGQQIWECLAVLVCLRTWSKFWKNSRFTIGFRGDNITSLTMTMKYKASSPGVRAIAREVAMELTLAPYPPVIYEHVPGIANQTADVLSRRFDPQKMQDWTLPVTLVNAILADTPVRDAAFYRFTAA